MAEAMTNNDKPDTQQHSDPDSKPDPNANDNRRGLLAEGFPSEKPPLPKGARVTAEGTDGELIEHKDDIFFAAIQTTRMPMLVTNPRAIDNPIVFANRAFLAMTGYRMDEVVGHNCRFLQGPATDRMTVAAIRDAIRADKEIAVEILNYRRDGSTFWNALYISPVFNPAGELVYFFASQLDVSRRRDAEESLAQAQKMEALGQLTGGISHDFNNLLQVMSGHIDIIDGVRIREGMDHPQFEHGLANIRRAVKKAARLTQHLLAFSRKQSLQGRVINLNASVTGMAELVHRTLGAQIAIAFELDGTLPNCDLDPTQLEVAILNVLVNARDAMPEGGTITMSTDVEEVVFAERWDAFAGVAPGRYVRLSITDGGRGIPAAIISRVMEPFFTTKEDGKGTGLGLAMVYGFAKQSRGLATIESTEGKGTTVRLWFPASERLASGRPVASTRFSERGGRETILVVDDRPELADLAQLMLEQRGYRVLTANSGAAAIALIDNLGADEPLHLVFSDVVMPGGTNGFQLANELRRRRPQLKVLLTTGYDRDFGSQEPSSSPEFPILMKPYRSDDLFRSIRQVLDGSAGIKPASS